MIKILFLDRDGIINIDKGYIHKVEDVEFVDGVFEMLTTAKTLGYGFIVITNQAGIAKGMYQDSDVHLLHQWIKDEMLKRGIDIIDFYHCPHHPEYTGACDCRKPAPGMILQAIEKYGADPSESIMIGDKQSDMQAGKNANLKCCILVSGMYETSSVPEADCFAENLYQAADYIRECSEA